MTHCSHFSNIKVEEEIRASHKAELAGMEESGQNAETVYRDRKARTGN